MQDSEAASPASSPVLLCGVASCCAVLTYSVVQPATSTVSSEPPEVVGAPEAARGPPAARATARTRRGARDVDVVLSRVEPKRLASHLGSRRRDQERLVACLFRVDDLVIVELASPSLRDQHRWHRSKRVNQAKGIHERRPSTSTATAGAQRRALSELSFMKVKLSGSNLTINWPDFIN